jgi:hypothetical protein
MILWNHNMNQARRVFLADLFVSMVLSHLSLNHLSSYYSTKVTIIEECRFLGCGTV